MTIYVPGERGSDDNMREGNVRTLGNDHEGLVLNTKKLR